jgi:tryptophan-rich sensory protein
VVEGAKKRDRRTVGRISRRPSAWFAWLLWALIIALGEILVFPYQTSWFSLTHPAYLDGEAIVESLGGLIFVLALPAFATVGAMVATLRPKNGVGWLCLTFGLLLVLVGMRPGGEAYRIPWNVLGPMQGVAWNLMVPPLPLTLMLLIFPEGRLPSRRWWAVVAIASVGYVLTFLGVYMPGDYAHAGLPVGAWIAIAALLTSVAAVVLRWRRSTDQERQQLKWLVYVVTLATVAGLAGLAGGQVWADAYVPAVLLVTAGVGLGIPVSIGVAVLKYRLYDIDVIINRTLVYGTLTATLALVYFGGVTLIQALLRTLTDQQELPQLVVVASTLLIAALFTPLRQRIQSFIDRSFYRKKYDAAKTLEGFSMKLRDETDLEALRGELVGVVTETMQPAHVSLWLRPVGRREPGVGD